MTATKPGSWTHLNLYEYFYALTKPLLLLGDCHKAWLIDLGLAVDLEAQDPATIKVAGTMNYMPPEALRNSLSTAWDMWALGTILYEVNLTPKP